MHPTLHIVLRPRPHWRLHRSIWHDGDVWGVVAPSMALTMPPFPSDSPSKAAVTSLFCASRNSRLDSWLDSRLDSWLHSWLDRRLDSWLDSWLDGRLDSWLDNG